MKKFFIYKNEKGIYSVAKTNKCKYYGVLVGYINGHITLEDVSPTDRPFKEDEICSLVNGQHLRIFEIKFY